MIAGRPSEQRRSNYARGRADARRLPVDAGRLRELRYLAKVAATDAERAYWLGVVREARA